MGICGDHGVRIVKVMTLLRPLGNRRDHIVFGARGGADFAIVEGAVVWGPSRGERGLAPRSSSPCSVSWCYVVISCCGRV